MKSNLMKKVIEATYLTAPNHIEYRYILNYFYEEHKKMRNLLSPDEIFAEMNKEPFFQDYTMNKLNQDLKSLVEYRNLIARQDARRANTIDEFKQKRYIYQITPYTIEIERMLERLEGITGFGGSLEPRFFDKFIANLSRVEKDWSSDSDNDVAIWWNDLVESFRQLSENAADYLAHLQSPKVEQLMMTESFLAFKDSVTEHLRKFMQALQQSIYRIEGILQDTTDEMITHILNRVCAYELSIPRLDEERDFETIFKQLYDKWVNLKIWFMGNEERQSELDLLQRTTNDTIRKITRYVIRLSENLGGIKNRKQEYLTLAKMFVELDDLKEAHLLSACTFGVFHTHHIFGEMAKTTERVDLSVWEEPAFEYETIPRIRTYRTKTRPGAMRDLKAEREKVLAEYLKQQRYEEEIMMQYIKDGGFMISELPIVEPIVRKMILRWIGRGSGLKAKKFKTENGLQYRIFTPDPFEWAILNCIDGSLKMPNYRFVFES